MRAPVSRALMALAFACMGESRRDWALAMRAEFDFAAAEGRAFSFALGCLSAAFREMPNLAEGRLVLGNYALALGLLIPMAALHFALALGFSSVLAGGGTFDTVVLAGPTPSPLMAGMQAGAGPGLLALWLMLGLGHLRLAWVVVERDWSAVAKAGAFIGATLATLFLFTGALALDLGSLLGLAAAMSVELAAVVGAARREERLFSGVA